ncbi:MAG TPA: pentapeptide repeat-containing protein [Candidatus Magasanikbacteria bacterium]|nr:pentapeptide repeat-containing protein [Candidatus Magasanikbacteria bacterium]
MPRETRSPQIDKPKKPTAEQVLEIMSHDKDLTGLDISSLHLNGRDLSNGKFRDCDAREIDLSPDGEKRTDIRNSDWTNATFASAGEPTSFAGVKAEGAVFGYEMSLEERQQMIEEIQRTENRGPNEFECGGYFGFDGTGADFKNTKWTNIDFGGGEYGAYFPEANFEGAIFDRCNLGEMDFEHTNLDRVTIILDDDTSLEGMRIDLDHAEAVATGIRFADPEKQKAFEADKASIGARKAIKKFGIEIIA